MSILASLLKERLGKERISEREAARQIGTSATTIGRALRGESLDVDTLTKICSWLGVRPSTVLDAYQPSNLGEQVSAILESHPELSLVFQETLGKIEEGAVQPDTMRDIVAYITYRINLMEDNRREPAKAGGITRRRKSTASDSA